MDIELQLDITTRKLQLQLGKMKMSLQLNLDKTKMSFQLQLDNSSQNLQLQLDDSAKISHLQLKILTNELFLNQPKSWLIMWGSMPLLTVSTTVITVLYSADSVPIPHE
jgi:hypothetical protein